MPISSLYLTRLLSLTLPKGITLLTIFKFLGYSLYQNLYSYNNYKSIINYLYITIEIEVHKYTIEKTKLIKIQNRNMVLYFY